MLATDTVSVALNAPVIKNLHTPANSAEAATLIRDAAARRTPVVPYGGGTAQGVGSPPPENALVLCTQKLNAVLDHEPGDLVATVQAGITLSALRAALRQKGQWLPLDGDPNATIGGMLATNRSGPRSIAYGSARDLVLGMTVINGDGVARKCGGKVVKNVTGYALDKLYIGSLGTLGLITEVTFKLRPMPIAGELWAVPCSTLARALELLRAVSRINLPIDVLQIFSREALARHAASAELLKQSAADFSEFTLLVSANGAHSELERMTRELTAVCGETLRRVEKPAGLDAAGESNHAFDLGSALGELGTAQRAWVAGRKTPGAIVRFWTVPSKLNAILEQLPISAATPFCAGTTGGVLDVGNADADYFATLGRSLEKAGANYQFEDAAGVKIAEPFGTPKPEWALMKKLRIALDPQQIMNPGRYVV